MSKIHIIIAGAAGRMGRMLINSAAADPELEVVGAVEYPQYPGIGSDSGVVAGCGANGVAIRGTLSPVPAGAEVLIDFATAGVIERAREAVAAGLAVVIGTTALPAADREELQRLAAGGGRVLLASNMSVGVNLLFKLVGEAARVLGPEYDVEIVEMHHNQKKDAPSGTAMTLAEVVCDELSLDVNTALRHGRSGIPGARTRGEIGMHSLRGGDVVGDHTVIFAINGERLELTHRASSRDTFARGALRAAKFLASAAPGMYDMRDVLKLK